MTIALASIAACARWQSTITVPNDVPRHVMLRLATPAQASCDTSCGGPTNDQTGAYAACLARCPDAHPGPGVCAVAGSAGRTIACGDVPAGATMILKTVSGRCAEQHAPGMVDCSERRSDPGLIALFGAIPLVALVIIVGVSN